MPDKFDSIILIFSLAFALMITMIVRVTILSAPVYRNPSVFLLPLIFFVSWLFFMMVAGMIHSIYRYFERRDFRR